MQLQQPLLLNSARLRVLPVWPLRILQHLQHVHLHRQHVHRWVRPRLLFARQRLQRLQWRPQLQHPPLQYARKRLLHVRLYSSCQRLRLRLFPLHLQHHPLQHVYHCLRPHNSLPPTHICRGVNRLHPPHQLHRQPR